MLLSAIGISDEDDEHGEHFFAVGISKEEVVHDETD